VKETLVHPDEAVRLVSSFLEEPVIEEVSLARSIGRILPQPVYARIDQPPFDKAAMDGWAWRPENQAGRDSNQPPGPLRVREVIAAGHSGSGELGAGETVKIMTGALLPPGAGRVQRVEWSQESGGLVRFTKTETADNVIRRGENARAGEKILGPRLLRAQDLAILAADGRAGVPVAKRPVVGVLSTGTELLEPGESLAPGRIYDSNRTQIIAQLEGGFCTTRDLGTLPDQYEITRDALQDALSSCDVLVLSGGVSMGDFDFVPRALSACGVEALFHGVAMKPGKPTFFGRLVQFPETGQPRRSYVFGLPGNPVSVFVNTELLVKSLLFSLSGTVYCPLEPVLTMAAALRRKTADRVEFLPVNLSADGVRPVAYGGSSAIQALANADGFARMDVGQTEIAEGGEVRVRLVR
jgi:molybdopterin molybdotransferase